MLKTKGTTVGQRIRDARELRQMTQLDVAKILGLSRAAIAQWESDTTSPSIFKVEEVSRLLETSPQWIAFGISQEPKVIYKDPPNAVTIKEIAFGESDTDIKEIRDWMVPTDYLKSELHALATTGLAIWRVEGHNMTPAYEYGDRVIVDLNAKRPSPSGVFLVWDGVGPALHQVTVTPVKGIPTARVSSTDGMAESYEVPVENLKIIGRVRGLLKQV